MTPADELERLLVRATAALEAGDHGAAAGAVASALALLGRDPGAADPDRLLPLHARLLELAERESARLSRELALLGSTRRALGVYLRD